MSDEAEPTHAELTDENKALKDEIETLKNELAHHKRTIATGKWTLKNLIVFGKKLFLGPSLDSRIKK